MKIKKLLSLLLASTMVLSLSACGNQESVETSSDASTETTSVTQEAASESSTEKVVPSEPITISVAPYMFNPVTEDIVTPLIEKMLLENHGINVDFEIIFVDQQNYRETINTQLAGGVAPDMFLTSNQSVLKDYANQGLLATFDKEMLQENAPTVFEWINNGGPHGDYKEFVDLYWNRATVDGQLVCLPRFAAQGAMPSKTLIYRGDWLEKLGVSEEDLPKTIDEFVDLMYRFAKEDPDGDGKDDTYGFSHTGAKVLFGAYGLYNGFVDGNSYWKNEDGELINADVHEDSKKVIELMAQMYADGVIDPEFVKGNEAIEGTYWAISNGFVNGLYGASCHASIDHYRFPGYLGDFDLGGPCMQEYIAVNGEETTVVYAPWPAGPEGEYGYKIGTPVSYDFTMCYNASVLDEPGKLETILQIMEAFAVDNELFMTAYYGIEGEHHNITEDGKIEWAEDYITNETGTQNLVGVMGSDRPFSDFGNEMLFDNEPSIGNRLSWFEKEQYDSHITDAVWDNLPSWDELKGELNTYRNETYVQMIRGEIPVSDWDKYVETYMSMGGQTLYEEAQEWYQNNK